MKVERKEWNDVNILTFVGEFDAFNLPTFSSKIDNLVEAGKTRLVFNLRLMTFINSSALGYLVKTKKRVEAEGGDLVLVQPSRFVKKALTVLGLHELFRIFETEEEGVLSFHRAEDVESVKIAGEGGDELLGENAIVFRLLDPDGGEMTEVFGHRPFVGKISSLYKEGLTYRWEVPGSGALSTENFDETMHPGRNLAIKFRQPFVAKTKFFNAKGKVMKVNKEIDDDGVTEASIHVEYTDIDPKDRAALEEFVKDLDDLRGEVRQ